MDCFLLFFIKNRDIFKFFRIEHPCVYLIFLRKRNKQFLSKKRHKNFESKKAIKKIFVQKRNLHQHCVSFQKKTFLFLRKDDSQAFSFLHGTNFLCHFCSQNYLCRFSINNFIICFSQKN